MIRRPPRSTLFPLHDALPIFEISTDKVDAEVPSPIAGVITEILVQPDETVTTGTVLCRIADRKSTRLNSSHANISYAVFCLNKKTLMMPSAELSRRANESTEL